MHPSPAPAGGQQCQENNTIQEEVATSNADNTDNNADHTLHHWSSEKNDEATVPEEVGKRCLYSTPEMEHDTNNMDMEDKPEM
jgi:hypothetical protein